MHLLHRLCNACAQVLTILDDSRCCTAVYIAELSNEFPSAIKP